MMIKKLLNRPVTLLDIICITIYSLMFANFSWYVAAAINLMVMIIAVAVLENKQE